MKLKYIIIVSLVLAVLTMGMVSASDDCQNNNLTDTFEDTITVSSDEDVQTIADDGESVIGDEEDDSGDLIDDFEYEVHIRDQYLVSDTYKSCSVDLPSDASGQITFKIDDYDNETKDVNGDYAYYSFNYLGLSKGEHNLQVIYTGDDTYKGFICEKAFNISSIIFEFPDEIELIDDWEEYYHFIQMQYELKGNVTIWIDDELLIEGDLEDYVWSWGDDFVYHYIPLDLNDFDLGPHTYNFTYTGDEVITRTGSFSTIHYFNVYCSNDEYGEDTMLEVILPNDAVSTIYVTVNNKTSEYASKGGRTLIPLTDLNYGNNIVSVTYGDEKYSQRTKNITVEIYSHISHVYEAIWNSGEGVSLKLPVDAIGNLTIYKPDDYEFTKLVASVPINDGEAFFDVSTWDLGSYRILVKYENGNYHVDECYQDFTVVPPVNYTKSVHVGDDANLTITLPDSATGILKVSIYEYKEYTFYDDKDPIQRFEDQNPVTLNTSAAGNYMIRVQYIDEDMGIATDKYYRFNVFDVDRDWELKADFPTELYSTEIGEISFNYIKSADGTFILYLDGEKVRWETINEEFYGYFRISMRDYAIGNHTWELKYVDDSYFNNQSLSGKFNVSWAKVPEIVEIGDYENENIFVGIAGVNKGLVEVYLDGVKHGEINLKHGYGEYPLENLAQNKVYSYELKYINANMTKTGTFTVSYAINTEMEGYDEYGERIYQESYDLKVILPSDATGTIQLTCGNKTYTGDLENGQTIIQLPLKYGENIVTINYTGDSLFKAKEVQKTFTIDWLKFIEIRDDDNLTGLSIYMPEDAVGEFIVCYKYDREFKRVPVTGGKNIIDLTDLPIGCYHMNVEYEDIAGKYWVENYYTLVSIMPEMTMPEEILEGNPCNIIIKLPGAVGNMDVYVDYVCNTTCQAVDGVFNITLNDLNQGFHKIHFEYWGDEYVGLLMEFDYDFWDYSYIQFDLNVYRVNEANLNVIADDIDVDDNMTIYVNINENATGIVVVQVSQAQSGIIIPGFDSDSYNETFNIEIGNGRGNRTITGLANGKYNVIAKYEGNQYVLPDEATGSFRVLDDPDLKAAFKDIEKGENFIANVTMKYKESNIVTLRVDLTPSPIQVIDVSMSNGQGKLNVSDLDIGEYTLKLIFDGDDYFKPATFTGQFKVTPKYEDPEMNIVAHDIDDGDNLTVSVTINAKADGIITVTVNGTEKAQTLSGSVMPKGEFNFTFENLPIGVHTITVNYTGTPLNTVGNGSQIIYYMPVVKTTEIEVKPIPVSPELNVNAEDIYEGQNATVIVTINENITGNVTININGEDKKIQIAKGSGSFTIPDLTVGFKEFEVKFEGDKYFLAENVKVNFTVKAKEDPGLMVSVSADEVTVGGEIIVNVLINSEVTGKVTISIDGEEKAIDINKGIGEYKLSGLNVGEYTYNVTFEGDEKFNADKKPVSFNIKPIEAEIIIINAENEYKTGNFTFKVINSEDGTPLSNVTVQLSSTSAGALMINSAVTDNDGIASFKTVRQYEIILDPPSYYLKVGKHLFDVEINDTKINASKLTTNLTITPGHFKININDYIGDYGSDNNWTFTVTNSMGETIMEEWFKISIPGIDEDCYGYVNFDGVGTISLKDVYPGTYEVEISNHNTVDIMNTTSTKNVTIRGWDAGFSATAKNIMVGKNATISVKINREFQGSITINVGGENKTILFSEGEGEYVIPDLAVGEYNYTVNYFGDKRFTSGNQTVRFNVTAKHDAGANITIPEKITGDGFDIVIGEGATGVITVTIDGNTTNVPIINGTAKVDLSKLSPGNHNITVRYDGDDNYAGFERNATVSIDSKEPETVPVKIIAKDLTVQYSDGSKYSVTVYGEDGNLAANVEVVFKVNGKKVATAKTNAKGVATLKITQTPKTYKITAEALGANVTKKLTVKQILTLKKVKVKRSAKKLVLKATLKKVKGKYLKGKKITFKFNGKKYTAKTNKKGVAKVTIKKKVLKKLKKGKKVTYSATYLKNTVKKTVKVKK